MMFCLTFYLALLATTLFSEPNPPTWPSNVYVFDPSNPSYTQQIINQVYAENGGHDPPNNGQWSNDRYAFLFMPGTHDVQVNVGYYTSVIGLSQDPRDTKIQNVVCEEGDYDYTGGALDNFWRSAEGFYTQPTLSWTLGVTMLWAVSQASPLRRVYIDGGLELWQYTSGCCAGYASGGYMSDSYVTGTTDSGSQQQYYFRNNNLGSWNGGVWNMVFQANAGQPAQQCAQTGGKPYSTIPRTPIMAEKPYVIMNSDGTYSINVPPLLSNTYGATSDYTQGTQISFDNVYVSTASDSAATINAKIADTSISAVVLTGGNYNLEEAIYINRTDFVLLGLGWPTLIPTQGNIAVEVGNVDGVRLAGPFLFQAGQTTSDTLLQIGEQGYSGSASNPVIIYDIFARVGGANDANQYQVSCNSMVVINTGYTILDDAWLWRADHDVSGLVYNGDNPVNNGIIINGDNVITYGLAVEHTLQDLVVWNGNNGQMYFYQSEFPYDVDSSYQTNGYTSVRINGNPMVGVGVGAYSYFRDNSVTVTSGIVTKTGSNFTNSLAVYLNGNGGITHPINNDGTAVYNGEMTSWVCAELTENNENEETSKFCGPEGTPQGEIICNNYHNQQ